MARLSAPWFEQRCILGCCAAAVAAVTAAAPSAVNCPIDDSMENRV